MNRLSVFQKKKGGLAATMEAGAAAAAAEQQQHDGDHHTVGETVMGERQRGGTTTRTTGTTTNTNNNNSKAPSADGVARPSYRVTSSSHETTMQQQNQHPDDSSYASDQQHEDDDSVELDVQNLVAQSAGAIRLNRILRTTTDEQGNANNRSFNSNNNNNNDTLFGGAAIERNALIEKVSDPHSVEEVALFAGRRVIPPLRVDASSIGGAMLDGYPETMLQECLLAAPCQMFESTTGVAETVTLQALQYPNEYSKHKRGLGLFAGGVSGGNKRASKLRYVLIARSANRPLRPADRQRQVEMLLQEKQRLKQQQLLQQQQQDLNNNGHQAGDNNKHKNHNKARDNDNDPSDRGDDYDAMFSPDSDDASKDLSLYSDSDHGGGGGAGAGAAEVGDKPMKQEQKRRESTIQREQQKLHQDSHNLLENVHRQLQDEDQVSSFPVLVCMTLHSDGSGPDIRKLIPLDLLTTVQDLHSTVVQLAFRNGDTIRLDFSTNNSSNSHEKNKAVVMERPLDKERFLWSLLQIHSMLCLSVVERNSVGTYFLPPLNIRNIDRAELQYVATVNGFLKQSEPLQNLLQRQRQLVQLTQAQQAQDNRKARGGTSAAAAAAVEQQQTPVSEEKVEMDDQDALAYDLLMGNHRYGWNGLCAMMCVCMVLGGEIIAR